jgi:hypothetical protein
MTTKIATSFGLALMLAMGILATMLALGVFTATKVSAIDAKPTVAAAPDEAGVLAEYRFTFVVTGTMTPAIGEIRITFDKDTLIPASLSRSNVLIKASRLSKNSPNATIGTTGGGQVVPLDFDPVIENDTADPRRKVVVIKVPDMNTQNAVDPGVGTQGIGVGFGTTGGNDTNAQDGVFTHAEFSEVTVIFTTAAGLKNATEQESSSIGIIAKDTSLWSKATNLITGTNTSVGVAVTAGIVATLKTDKIDGARGTKVTVTGRGFNNDTTATVFLDTDGDGVRDADEIDLASALIGSDDTFTASFTVSNPPFKPGNNKIAAVDGELRTLTKKDSAGNLILGNFELKGSVTPNPTTAAVGDTVQLQLKDFDKSVDIKVKATITIGGVGVTIPTASTDANGEATFDIVVPDGVAIGGQTLAVSGICCTGGGGASSTRDTVMTIGGAVLNLTPTTVVPNQTLTVIGRGFTKSSSIDPSTAEAKSLVSISGSTNRLKAAGAAGDNNVNEGNKITIDAGGNWSAAIVIPINSTTTTPGTHEFKVVDAGGRDGTVSLTISPRTVKLSPEESRVGTTVTVQGSGFPANNTKTGAASVPSVKILYVRSGGTDTVATATPDASGNFTSTFLVPLNAGIPSTNTVRAEFDDEDKTTVSTATVHKVPTAALTISPTSGAPGTKVTVSGVGFKGFSTVTELKLGDLDVRPAPVPATNDVGSFNTEVLVPQLNLGVQTVTAKVGDTVASTSYTVTAAPVAPPPPAAAATVTPAAGLAPLGANLVRTWGYDAPTQKFQLYDPAAALLSDLTVLKRGGGYWINVKSAQKVTLGTFEYDLSAGWNNVGWQG